MKKIYFVRHGETNYNAEDKVQDHTSILTGKGVEQAQLVANRLKNLSFDHLVSSDYERTKQTAEVVKNTTGKEPIHSDLFREVRRPSEFLHQPRSGAFFNFVERETENFAIDENWKHSDEESFTEVQNRIKEAFNFIEKLDGDIVVISHGHFIRRVIATVAMNFNLNGKTWQHMYPSFSATNTGITTIIKRTNADRFQILTFNDHAHFADN